MTSFSSNLLFSKSPCPLTHTYKLIRGLKILPTSSFSPLSKPKATRPYLPPKLHLHPPSFLQLILLSDGSSFHISTPSPRPVLQLTKDPRNHVLWNPHIEVVDDSAGEISKFIGRFGEGLGVFSTPSAPSSTSNPASNLNFQERESNSSLSSGSESESESNSEGMERRKVGGKDKKEDGGETLNVDESKEESGFSGFEMEVLVKKVPTAPEVIPIVPSSSKKKKK